MTVLAYVAPDTDDDATPRDVSDDHLDALSEQWAAWCRTRRFYGRVSVPVSLLGKLREPSRGYRGGRNAFASAELAAFNLAVHATPATSLDRRVFELHYLWRAPNITAAAAAVGISRQHWYRLVSDFRREAYARSRAILATNTEAANGLPSEAMRALVIRPDPS